MSDQPYTASDFEYELPPDLIAQTPSEERSSSRLLLLRRAGEPPGTEALLEDLIFSDLLTLIPAGDLVVLNTTRVRPARVLGRRPSGAPAEVLLIRPMEDGSWLALGKPGSALEPGKRIELEPEIWVETIEVLSDGHRRVRFLGASAEEVMARCGKVPLPPYIIREPTPLDLARYQTVYAKREGSVAAPTAGLHFTNQLLDALSTKGVVIAGLDLEVGSGTFKPVEAEQIADHPMHTETYEIPDRVAALTGEIRRLGGRIWAVGTTVVRALESAADDRGRVRPGRGATSLLITPGYQFKAVDRLITNFHLPRSTLLMLVSAFAGFAATRTAYQHAIERRYRFYSYGDAMVVV